MDDTRTVQTAPALTSGQDRKRWAGLGVLAAALSMIVLDGTIVGVALPTLISSLKLDFSQAQWVNGIYAVVFAALLPTAGRLGDRLGRRAMLLAGIAVFMAGSLMASLAGDASLLILARVVQGVGGAFILPATLSNVNATFRGRDRAIAFGVWGAVISGMAALGPLIGGWITTSFTWQWIFIVNLPIGLILIVGALITVRESRTVITAPGLDVDGLLLSVIGFATLVFGLIEGQSLGWWKPASDFTFLGLTFSKSAPISPVPIALAIGVAALVLFVVWERHRARIGRSALLDLSLFGIATFRWGNLVALCVAIGEFGLLFVLPLFIVNAMGLTTLGAGLVLAAMGGGAFVAGAQARHLTARWGAPTVVLIGLTLETIGVVAVAFLLSPGVSPWLLAAVLLVYGVGLGLASAQLTSTILVDVPPEQSGQASATQSTVRQVGSALGTAVIGAVFAAALGGILPGAIEAVPGVPAPAAQQFASLTQQAAGGTIAPLREQGEHSKFGPATPQVVDALSDGMADSARVSLFSAAGFLAAGGVVALGLRARAGRQASRTKSS